MRMRGKTSARPRLPRGDYRLDPQVHAPKPWPDGSIECLGCGPGMRFSPVCYAGHLVGKPPQDAIGNVYRMNTDDWLPKPDAAAQPRRAPMPARELREEPRVAHGVMSSIFD